MENLSIALEASITQFENNLNIAQKAIQNFGKEAAKVDDLNLKVKSDTSDLRSALGVLREAEKALKTFSAASTGVKDVDFRVNSDTSTLDSLSAKLKQAITDIQNFAAKADATAAVDLTVNTASIDVSSLKARIDEAVSYLNKLKATDTAVDVQVDANVTGLDKVRAQLQQATGLVQAFADKAQQGANVKLNVDADAAEVANLENTLTSATQTLRTFNAQAQQVAGVDLRIDADTSSLNTLKASLASATAAINDFKAKAGAANAGIEVNADVTGLNALQAKLAQAETALRSFEQEARNAGAVELKIKANGDELTKLRSQLEAAAQAVHDFSVRANTTADINLSVNTDLGYLKTQIEDAAAAVSRFAAQTGVAGDVKINVAVDATSLKETANEITAFAAKTDGIEDIHLKVTTDATSLETVKQGLNEATREANAFATQIQKANSTNLNLSDDTAQVDAFNAKMAEASSRVTDYSKRVAAIPSPKMQVIKAPPIAINTQAVESALSTLNDRLRIAQANVELFGNQFEGDKLKVVAYQQALNQLISAGLNPTSKEVLKVADSMEKLTDELAQAEATTKRMDLFSSFKATGKIIPDLENKAKRLQTALRNATNVKDIERYQKRLAAVNQQLAQFGTRGIGGVNNLNKGMNNLSGSAGQVSTEFSRLIQDAPYAANSFGAISNNVTQLVDNFKNLRAQSGSTGQALKAAFAASFTGMGALSLGIAALTSGFVAYQMWSQRAAKSTTETASEMERMAKAADDYVGSLDGVNRARAEGLRDAQEEVTVLKLLYERTQDAALSTEERRKAALELQKVYPETFKNFTTEQMLTGQTVEAYKALTSELLRNAEARAALNQIQKKAEQKVIIKEEIQALKERRAEVAKQVEQARKLQAAMDAAAASSNSIGSTGSITGAQKVYNLQSSFEELGKTINERVADIAKLDKQMAELVPGAVPALFEEEKESKGRTKKIKEEKDHIAEMIKAFNLATKQALVYGDSFDVIGAKISAVRAAIDGLLEQGVKPDNPLMKGLQTTLDNLNNVNFEKLKMTFADITGNSLPMFSKAFAIEALKAANAFKPLQSKLDQVSLQMKGFLDYQARISQSEQNIELGNFQGITQGVDTALSKMSEGYEKVEAMRSLIGGAVTSAFTSLGQGMANMFLGLATGADALALAGKALLDTLSQIAAEFGKKLIAIGVGESLMGIPTGAAKIAAGVALVALGGVGSGMASGIGRGGAPSVATNISGTGGYRTPGVDYGGVNEVKFKIAGNDLIAVMDRAQGKQRRVRG